MIPKLPYTLGFTPDDDLIDNLASVVVACHFDYSIAKSVVKQLLDSVSADFTNCSLEAVPSLYDFLAETTEDFIFTACYATYRPSNCRCKGSQLIFFQLYFFSEDFINFDIIEVELADESLLNYMPKRDFHPTAEDRARSLRT